MTSREKVLALRRKAMQAKPEDEETAQWLQLLVAFSPMLLKAMPEDPRQLDRMLEQLAGWAVECRSDEALPLAVHRWNREEECWEGI